MRVDLGVGQSPQLADLSGDQLVDPGPDSRIVVDRRHLDQIRSVQVPALRYVARS